MQTRIKKEQLLEKNGVFVILYSDNYGEHEYDAKVLMTMRWNNNRGFLGGHVDAGETLRQALDREVMEEGNFDITNKEVEWLSSYDLNGFGIHCYVCKISPEEMENIRINYTKATHAAEEVSGLLITNLKTGEINQNLLGGSFEATCRAELIDFMVKYIYNRPLLDRTGLKELAGNNRRILDLVHDKNVWSDVQRYINSKSELPDILFNASHKCLNAHDESIPIIVDGIDYKISFDGQMFEMKSGISGEDTVRSVDLNRFITYCFLYFTDTCAINELCMGGLIRLNYRSI